MEIYEYDEVAQVHGKIVLDQVDVKSTKSGEEGKTEVLQTEEGKTIELQTVEEEQSDAPKKLRSRLDQLTEKLKALEDGPLWSRQRNSEASRRSLEHLNDTFGRADDSMQGSLKKPGHTPNFLTDIKGSRRRRNSTLALMDSPQVRKTDPTEYSFMTVKVPRELRKKRS